VLRADAHRFDLPGDDRGVLLLHGFTATPFEMRYLGDRLAERGYTVVGPALAGHGGSAAALDATTWPDWFAGVEHELDELRRRCRRVAVIGQSLGGLLTLHLARARGAELAAAGVLAAPLWLPPATRLGIRALHALATRMGRAPRIPKRGGPDIRDLEMRAASPSLTVFPLRALHSVVSFGALVRDQVGQITVPTFVAHSRRDHVVPPACSRELVQRIGSRDVTYLPLTRSFHVLPLDVEKDLLADALARFLAKRM
jgi:carboxylesterase